MIELPDRIDLTLHLLDNLETPENTEEVKAIRKKIETYRIGLQRVRTEKMVAAVLAGLEALTPQIDALASRDNS